MFSTLSLSISHSMLLLTMRLFWEIFLFIILTLCFKPTKSYPFSCYCSSWRLGVESNNIRGWRTIPTQCLTHVEYYMLGGQYHSDLDLIIDHIYAYIDTIVLSSNAAWILDVDDTCISNLQYYRTRRFGCDPFDPVGFKAWAVQGACPAVPQVLRLFEKLVSSGFKVFLVTGRDEESLGQATAQNLHDQGFVGYERLILRPVEYRGQSAISFKSVVRKQLMEKEGYKIWGNVGDQWSDLAGDCLGERTFKLPNPMYFVP